MASNDEYQQREFWEGDKLQSDLSIAFGMGIEAQIRAAKPKPMSAATYQDFKDLVKAFENKNQQT